MVHMEAEEVVGDMIETGMAEVTEVVVDMVVAALEDEGENQKALADLSDHQDGIWQD